MSNAFNEAMTQLNEASAGAAVAGHQFAARYEEANQQRYGARQSDDKLQAALTELRKSVTVPRDELVRLLDRVDRLEKLCREERARLWNEGFDAGSTQWLVQRDDPSHPITRDNPYREGK